MIPANIPGRVAILERQMHAIAARFDALSGQISQFREEMHVALAATKDELLREVGGVRAEALTALAATRAELKSDNDATRRQMRVLHEEVLDRLKKISRG